METLNQLTALLKSITSLGAGTLTAGMASAVVLLLAAGLGVKYLKGKLKPLKLPLKPALCGCEPAEAALDVPLPGLLERISLTIDYLRTRREWRYEKPWVMMLGELGAGKSSLLASISSEYQQALHGRYKQLAINGTSWHDFNQGFFIDPKGLLPYSAASSQNPETPEHTKAIKVWNSVLKQLNDLRPERALDAIVLVISAANLQHQSREERQLVANNIRQQLLQIGQKVEFSLPVYVVVTALDSVAGFAEFWRAQTPERRTEIMGWSAPAQSLDSPPDAWVGEAFDQVARQLKPLQLESAAERASIDANDADQAFLFPHQVQQLKEPLQECLSIIFQASPWQSPFFCRGIYFTGVVANKGSVPLEQSFARNDVAFIQDVFLKKILVEPGLAKPTRVGVWSRNLLIRRLQIALVAGFGLLLLALAVTCFQVDAQVDRVVDTLKRIQQMQASVHSDDSCILKEPVFQLVEQVATIDARARSWVIPVSAIDNRLSRKSAERIANEAFKNVVLPGLACQIKQRANVIHTQSTGSPVGDNYPQALAALKTYVAQVNDVEKNVARFKRELDAPPFPNEADRLPEFFKLVEYAYGAPLPAQIKLRSGLLNTSLAHLDKSVYNPANLVLPANFRYSASNYILASAEAVSTQLTAELERGSYLLNLLQQRQQPILLNTQEFSAWLNWVRSAWIGSSKTQNPFLRLQTELSAQLQPLIQDYAYPAAVLKSATSQFDAANRYPVAMDALNKMQLPGYGSLFTVQNKQLDLNPTLNIEMLGLQALSGLGYMKIDPLMPFICQGKVASWKPDYLNQAAGYFKQYQGLLDNPLLKDAGLKDVGAKPLYQQLAAYQLELALNHSLQQAQASALASDLSLTNSDTSALGSLVEQQQNRDTLKFSALLAPIQTVQGIFNSLVATGSATNLDKCVSQFAKDELAQIQLITEQSLLYQITVTPAASAPTTSSNVNADFFDLGSTPVVKDFLARQLSRVQVLAGYASPFLDYLKQSASVPNPNTSNPDTATYWNNTTLELQRYNQAKDPNAQATLLNNLFFKQFPGMNASNCQDILNAYQSPELGNDLFSNYRHELENAVTKLCNNKRSSQAANLYDQWASRFNKELAGLYPFGPLSADDASLATVKAFFTDYEASQAALSQSINGFTGASWAERKQFLTRLDAVAAFLHNSLSQPGLGNTKVNLAVTFRALAGEGSEQVSNWRLASAGNSIAYPNQGTNLDWPFGQAIALDLTWASNSIWRPAFGNGMQVTASTATFSASGNWALLRLIANHPPTSGASLDTLTAGKVLLEFDVPLMSSEQSGTTKTASAKTGSASLYLSMQFSSIDPTTKAPVSLILPDIFPTEAPK